MSRRARHHPTAAADSSAERRDGRRVWRLAAAAAVVVGGLYVLVFLPTAYFRFDDFWQMNESIVHAPAFGDMLTAVNAADGRWNPGMRLVWAALGAVFGVDRAWVFYLVLFAAHVLNIALIVRIARVCGAGTVVRGATAFVGIAAVNFSAFSLISVALLYSMLSTACILGAVLAAASYARRERMSCLVACAVLTMLALLFREIGSMAPLLALLVAGTAAKADPRRHFVPLLLAFGSAALVFLLCHLSWHLPLVPEAGRYHLAFGWHFLRSLAIVLANAGIWLVVPAWMAVRQKTPAWSRMLILGFGWAVLATLPTLLLPWSSPGHLYPALFGVALASGQLWGAAGDRRGVSRVSTSMTMAGTAVCVLAIVVATMASYRVLSWGPRTRQALADWVSLRRPSDGRPIWFDADNASGVPLARLIGPGIRLRDALEFSSKTRVGDALICIDADVGPMYEAQPDDALFLYKDGRLTRIAIPPFPHAHCF